MITEDYVSFEIAKLLKEKGFDTECHSHYYPCHYPDGSVKYEKDKGAQRETKIWYNVYSLKNLPKDHYLAPTLQMAMKWLREVHNIFIDITTRFSFNSDRDINFSYNCHKLVDIHNREFSIGDGEWLNYEEACEAAIKYCLEKLI